MLDALLVRAVASGIAALYLAGAAYALKAGRNPMGGGREFRAEDPGPAVLQRLWEVAVAVPNLYPFAVALVPDWTYGSALTLALPFAEVAQAAGFALWLVGGGLVAWSARVLGRHMITRIAVMRDHELVTAGPYARVRHPTYLGVLLIGGGLTLFFLSALLVPFFALAAVLARYRAYAARTGRFLPRLRK